MERKYKILSTIWSLVILPIPDENKQLIIIWRNENVHKCYQRHETDRRKYY